MKSIAKTRHAHQCVVTAFFRDDTQECSCGSLSAPTRPEPTATRRMIPVRTPPISAAARYGSATLAMRSKTRRIFNFSDPLGIAFRSFEVLRELRRGLVEAFWVKEPQVPTTSKVAADKAHVCVKLKTRSGASEADVAPFSSTPPEVPKSTSRACRLVTLRELLRDERRKGKGIRRDVRSSAGSCCLVYMF